jgi:hypothetical protein
MNLRKVLWIFGRLVIFVLGLVSATEGSLAVLDHTITDFVEVAERPDLPISTPMALAIVNLPEGAELAHWLGQPAQQAEVERLSKIADPAAVMLEMGKLAASRAAVKPAPAQRRSGNETRQKAPDEMTMTEYANYRAEKLKAERRPGIFGGR